MGTGAYSAPSNSVVPDASPQVVPNVGAGAADGQATVYWLVPDNNGSPITSFVITPVAGGTAGPRSPPTPWWGPRPTRPAGRLDSYLMTGLKNGTSYTFTVAAVNGVGSGPAGTSNSVTPHSGFWMVAGDGGIFAFGNAGFYGSMGGRPLNKPIVGLPRPTTTRATGRWRRTAGSSPSVTRRSTARWAASPSTSRSSA